MNWRDWLALSDGELTAKAKVQNFKGSGKGGQKRNKTSNGVRIQLESWVVEASSARSREENLKKALGKLRRKIAFDPAARTIKQLDFPILKRYIQQELIRINEKNPEYPLFLGELFDLYQSGLDLAVFAENLGTTKSQLNRWLEKEPELKMALQRSSHGAG